MKTKKNTRSNPKLDNKFADIFVVLIALLIACSTIFLFWKNLNKTLNRDKPSIAIVSYKEKSVQRKFIDRAVWDRPAQYSHVYNGDTIRTASNSEAVIYFTDKSTVNVGENTMIQIFKPRAEKDVSVQISEGNVSVKTVDSKMLVRSGNASLAIEKESVLHTSKSGEEPIKIAVEKGEASVSKVENAQAEDSSDSVIESSVLKAGTVLVEGGKPSITMISPSSSEKIFNFNKEPIEVLFRWQSSFPEMEDLIFEISSSRNFNADTEKVQVKGLSELKRSVSSGNIFWRLYSSSLGPEDVSAAKGKLSITDAPPPKLLEPNLNEEFSYVNDLPAIKFSWEGNSAASNYLIELADNDSFENPKLSRLINASSVNLSGIEDGKWYWRVVPNYITEGAPSQTSETGVFYVQKTKNKEPIVLDLSQNMSETLEGNKAFFSWPSVPEAKKYNFRISTDESMSNIVFEKVLTSNYFEIKNFENLLPSSGYYWNIAALDKNEIPVGLSKPEKIKIGGEEIFIRSVFPPDGYVIADSFCKDTQFTWKTNTKDELYFQVSSSQDFKKLAADKKVNGSSVEGVSLEKGEWYWRVLTKNKNNDLKSEVKKLIIVPPLSKPEFIDLKNKIIILPKGENKFKWTQVPEAEYYRFRITPEGLNQKPVYENSFITGTEIDVDIKSIENGSYIISVQAFASLNETAGKRYGYTADRKIELMHLKPVELIYPIDGMSISGMDAVLKPEVLKWSSVEDPETSRLILIKVGEKNPVLSIQNPETSVQLPPLGAGKYIWKLIAKTAKGFDISSRKDASFKVLPIPLLEAPDMLAPKQDTTLNADFFKNNRSIKFVWTRIPEADHYLVRIYNSSKTVYRDSLPQTVTGNIELNFTKLNLLSRGVFYIEVRAQQKFEGTNIVQDGKAAVRKFKIELPQSKKVSTDETGVMYGQ
ncbi:FecR domain-containing protein [Treponema sp. OMZ 792]|uniref:FecR family protein n=1 Tax=unclassified Treponema TaxID=2638727 RepID=UPI0020A26FBE|nr:MULTISPECIES: FecR family protein [unclassified Treponema]UTC75564.1 FecR domain-containing protein [Treponema sp. OMZ 792]UTC79567.1 FecR domain-containing protein [Treponema sp. OMZ 798]